MDALELGKTLWNNPEPGFFEWETQKILSRAFGSLGFEVEEFRDIPGFIAADKNPREKAVYLISDMDALLERVRKHGFSHTDKKPGADQSWQAWLEDPDGVRIELHEYTPNSSQLTGKTCVVNW